jgi:hypothetical protein
LQTFEIALHEWIGLAAYRATSRIDRLFPQRRSAGISFRRFRASG